MKKYSYSKLLLPLSALSLTLALMPAVPSYAVVTNAPTTATASKPIHFEKIAPTGTVDKHDQTKRVWNLRDADIKAVITTIAQLTGRTFLIDPNINGRVSIVSKKPMTVDELYQVFLTMLQTLNYTAVRQGLVTRVVPLTDAKQYANEVSQQQGQQTHLNQQVVIDVVPVQHVSALQLVTVLQPLVPNDGLITAYNPSNAIVVSGTAEMVQRVRKLVHTLDSQSGSELANVKLQHATAKNLVKLLQELQKNDQSEGKVNTVSYAADDDTNSILVSGSAQNLKQAKALINKLDSSSSKVDSGLTVLHLQYVAATTIVPILAKLAGGNVTSTGGSAAGSSTGGAGLGSSMMGMASALSGNSGADDASSGSDGTGSMMGDSDSTIGSDTSSIFQTQQVVSGGGKNFSLVAVPSTNNIIVSAPAMMVKKLKKIVKLLDVRPKQVLVQALIVRVNQALLSQLGIAWGTMVPGTNGGMPSMEQGAGLIKGTTIAGVFQALNTDNNSDILATPSIVVQNNQKALIADGENIAIPGQIVTSTTGTTQGYDRKNVQLSLMVKPQVNSNNSVTLTIAQQDNELDQSQGNAASSLTGGGAANAESGPNIETSTITTQVMVPNSDVLVLGGLLKKERSTDKSGIPILSKIPLLGRLFTFNNVNHVKQNLLIFLKPTVLKNQAQDLKVSHKLYQGVRNEQLKDAASDGASNIQYDPVLPRLKGQDHLQLPQPFDTHH